MTKKVSIEVVTKNDASPGLKAVGEDLKRVGDEAAKVAATTGRARDAFGRFVKQGTDPAATSLRRVGEAAGQAAGGGGGFGGGIMSLASSLQTAAGAFGLMAVAREGFDAAQLAADAERAERAFVAFSGSAQSAAVNLAAVQRASGNAIPEMQAMRQAAGLLGTGMVDSTADLERFVKVATTLGAAFAGLAAPDAIQELKLTFLNQSIERLDSFGISSGRVRDRIQELQAANKDLNREQAFFQASMEQAEESMGKLEAAGFDASNGLDEARAAAVDLKVELGKGLLPVVNLVAEGLAGIFRGTTDANKEQRAYAEASRRLVIELIAQNKTEEALRLQRDVAIATSARDLELMKQRITATAQATGTTDRLTEILAEFGIVSKAAQPSVFDLLRGIEGLGTAAEGTEKKAKGVLGVLSEMAALNVKINEAFRPDQPGLFDWMEGVREEAARAAQQKREDAGREIQQSARDIARLKADREEAARELNESLADLERDRGRMLQDMAREAGRRLTDIEREAGQARVDAAREYAEARAEAERDYLREVQAATEDFLREQAQAERSYQQARADAYEEYTREQADADAAYAQSQARDQQAYNRQTEQAEAEHVRRIAEIQSRGQQDVEEAIRQRDGRALMLARQRMAREIKEEEESYRDKQQEQQENFQRQQQERAEDYQRQRQERAREYAQQEQEREEDYREQQRERQANFQREQQERQVAYQRKLQDMQVQHQQELQRINQAAEQERQALRLSQQRQLEDYRISEARRRADLLMHFQQQQAITNAALQTLMQAHYQAVVYLNSLWYQAQSNWAATQQAAYAANVAGQQAPQYTDDATRPAAPTSSPRPSGGGSSSSNQTISVRPTSGGVVVNVPGMQIGMNDAHVQSVVQSELENFAVRLSSRLALNGGR